MKKEFKKSFEGKEGRGKRAESPSRFEKKDFGKKENRPYKTGAKKEADNNDKPAFAKKFPARKRDNAANQREFEPKRFPKRKDEGEKTFGEKRTKNFGEKKGFERKENFKPRERSDEGKPFASFDKKKRSFSDKKFDKKPFDKKEDFKPRERSDEGKPFASFDKKKRSFSDKKIDKKPFDKKEEFKPRERSDEGKPFASFDKKKRSFSDKKFDKKPFDKKEDFKPRKKKEETTDAPISKPETGKEIAAPMTLNKYIAHSGECSRRDAAEFVKQGKVRVNGELVLEPGHRVLPGDTVTLSGKKMTPQKNLVYLLLNKPKDFITTTEDPQERKTVMDLVENSGVDRLYPVGRLDRNTTGLLLLTNDGALAHKLSHPSYQIRKVYHVTLDKNLTKADYEKIFKGLELEDGLAQVDEIAYLENRHEIGLEIHNGRNRIVRRIFESLGYVVEKLDRVIYAGLTKKNLPRGKWRFLDEKEIIFLKHFKN